MSYFINNIYNNKTKVKKDLNFNIWKKTNKISIVNNNTNFFKSKVLITEDSNLNFNKSKVRFVNSSYSRRSNLCCNKLKTVNILNKFNINKNNNNYNIFNFENRNINSNKSPIKDCFNNSFTKNNLDKSNDINVKNLNKDYYNNKNSANILNTEYVNNTNLTLKISNINSKSLLKNKKTVHFGNTYISHKNCLINSSLNSLNLKASNNIVNYNNIEKYNNIPSLNIKSINTSKTNLFKSRPESSLLRNSSLSKFYLRYKKSEISNYLNNVENITDNTMHNSFKDNKNINKSNIKSIIKNTGKFNNNIDSYHIYNNLNSVNNKLLEDHSNFASKECEKLVHFSNKINTNINKSSFKLENKPNILNISLNYSLNNKPVINTVTSKDAKDNLITHNNVLNHLNIFNYRKDKYTKKESSNSNTLTQEINTKHNNNNNNNNIKLEKYTDLYNYNNIKLTEAYINIKKELRESNMLKGKILNLIKLSSARTCSRFDRTLKNFNLKLLTCFENLLYKNNHKFDYIIKYWDYFLPENKIYKDKQTLDNCLMFNLNINELNRVKQDMLYYFPNENDRSFIKILKYTSLLEKIKKEDREEIKANKMLKSNNKKSNKSIINYNNSKKKISSFNDYYDFLKHRKNKSKFYIDNEIVSDIKNNIVLEDKLFKIRKELNKKRNLLIKKYLIAHKKKNKKINNLSKIIANNYQNIKKDNKLLKKKQQKLLIISEKDKNNNNNKNLSSDNSSVSSNYSRITNKKNRYLEDSLYTKNNIIELSKLDSNITEFKNKTTSIFKNKKAFVSTKNNKNIKHKILSNKYVNKIHKNNNIKSKEIFLDFQNSNNNENTNKHKKVYSHKSNNFKLSKLNISSNDVHSIKTFRNKDDIIDTIRTNNMNRENKIKTIRRKYVKDRENMLLCNYLSEKIKKNLISSNILNKKTN